MQHKSKLDELLENTQGALSEDEIEVYGGEGEADADMDMGYDDDEAVDLDAEAPESAEEGDLDELIDQLKNIVDELEGMEDDLGAGDDEIEVEGDVDGDVEVDLEFDDEVEEAKCGSQDEDCGLDEAADTASGAGDVAPEGGKATGPEAKEGGSAGKADDSKVAKAADDEEAIDDTIDAIEKSAPGKDNTAQTGNKVDVKKTSPAIVGTGEGIVDVKLENVEVDLSKEIAAIVSLDSTLSESAQKKTAKLFENAVNKKVSMINRELSAQYTDLVESRCAEFETQLVEKVDQYLDYVVDNYMTENTLAIEEGLKVRVSGSFLEGLGKLFEEHYVSVPSGKVDLVEKLESEIEQAEAKQNKLYEHAIKLRRENVSLRKASAVRKLTEGMSAVEVSKFKTLVEGVEYKSQSQFVKAIEAVKATHFINEDVATPEPQEFETLAEETKASSMDKYVSAIRRFK